MALFIRQNEERSKLQERLVADLQEKSKKNFDKSNGFDVDDSEYMKDLKQTTSLSWVWLIIAIIAAILVIWLLIVSSGK